MGLIHRLLAGAVALLAVGMPGAAYAEKWGAADPAGDVHAFDFDPEPAPCGTLTDWDSPANTSNDITRLVVNHTLDRVVLTLRFRNLRWAGAHMTEFDIRTNERGYLLSVDRFRTGARTETFLAREPSIPEPDPDAECPEVGYITSEIPCARLVARIKPDLDVVTVSIPRRCLSTPRWVQVGASNLRFVDDGPIYSDQWAPPGSDTTGFFGPYGPRVRSS